ncbi:hypothetical protein [Desulfotignum phosphitoxidans]|uniref:Uncharacterized protein n=1 Tax=Desulfotignum phosphitoxidans DSM 13687 TaxID=1286635 RepID=S0G549_9BACT|nr:hypothetical protein [Desulfotignum phosphitoxidans]EMS79171.1 hypothetical protein Dpo_5c00940 [Desulfotignum phosphitoxidans DSM 13687]
MPESDLKDKIIQAIKENQTPEQSTSKHHKKTLYSIMIVSALTTLCLVLSILFINNLFSKAPPPGPWARITFPLPGTTTGTKVKITAETRNIEPGQHIWLAVDKPDLELCWPKSPRLMPNTGFSTTIYERGPNEPYRVSVYAVTKTLNDQWEDWVNKKQLGGLPMPPKQRRLASVVLVKMENT